MANKPAKPILYTNRRCPWAHRVHIILEELKLDYEEVTIDLDKPRTPEYLKINPRGKVPALSHDGEILIESDVIANYLADTFPPRLLPASNSPGGPRYRARVTLFVNSFKEKVWDVLTQLYTTTSDKERAEIVEKAISGLEAEVEPKLSDANPFFGGSTKLTQAEVLTASLAIRVYTLAQTDIYPTQLWPTIAQRAPHFAEWTKAISAHPSVTSIYDPAATIATAKSWIAKAQAAKN
ncbi:thioredoxin-like protein [Podospora australis]|uniref:Thioredoxin-like protein n=1 Tax=Podospora australis TaxID=1536484 RepID=A0AAN6WQS2_9PEZI|nr:thioredoxin-like protein [Podospora australis]